MLHPTNFVVDDVCFELRSEWHVDGGLKRQLTRRDASIVEQLLLQRSDDHMSQVLIGSTQLRRIVSHHEQIELDQHTRALCRGRVTELRNRHLIQRNVSMNHVEQLLHPFQLMARQIGDHMRIGEHQILKRFAVGVEATSGHLTHARQLRKNLRTLVKRAVLHALAELNRVLERDPARAHMARRIVRRQPFSSRRHVEFCPLNHVIAHGLGHASAGTRQRHHLAAKVEVIGELVRQTAATNLNEHTQLVGLNGKHESAIQSEQRKMRAEHKHKPVRRM